MCASACVCFCKCACMLPCVCACVHASWSVCTHIHASTSMCMCVYVCAPMSVCTCDSAAQGPGHTLKCARVYVNVTVAVAAGHRLIRASRRCQLGAWHTNDTCSCGTASTGVQNRARGSPRGRGWSAPLAPAPHGSPQSPAGPPCSGPSCSRGGNQAGAGKTADAAQGREGG